MQIMSFRHLESNSADPYHSMVAACDEFPCHFFHEGIQGTEARRRYLDLADSCGLDVMRITKLVVENIRNRSSNEFTSTAESLQDTNTSEA